MKNPCINFYTSSFEDITYLKEFEENINLKYKRHFNSIHLTKEFFDKWDKWLFKESSSFFNKNGKLVESYINKFWIIEDEYTKDGKKTKQKIYLFNREPQYYEFEEENFDLSKINLYYSENTELVSELIGDILNSFRDINKTKKSTINIIIENNNNLTLKSFDIKSKEIDFNKHYNPDCKEFVDDLLSKLGENKGLFLMHGIPGTGKTSLIRWIITQSDKKIIYIPPDMTSIISNPNFMKFLKQHPKSVLLIEDAETVLMKRVSGGSSAIQNILNLSDGLLSDILEIQVIATFNTNIKDIDSALLRPGRLNGIYEFKELEDDIAKNLCNELGVDFDLIKEKTLAEIFNFNDKFSFEKRKPKKKVIGFSTK